MEIPNRAKYIKEIREQWEGNYVKCELNIKFYNLVLDKYTQDLKATKDKEKITLIKEKIKNVEDVLKAEKQSMQNTVEYLEIVN